MGALHAGHVSLMHAATKECDCVVATIFVNPTQFGPSEDLNRYPRTLESDLEKCRNAGVQLVFAPAAEEMYLSDAQTQVRVGRLTQVLEGRIRPTHFDGVTTVVAKLFNITSPNKAYFGQKDFQQQLVIRQMVTDLNWDIEVVTCPIVRESDGLALSSRNRYLSPDDRERSKVLYRALQLAAQLAGEASASPMEIEAQMKALIASIDGVVLEYAIVADRQTLERPLHRPESAVALLAARVGETRLIDNHILQFC